jgi:hypothetical protein
MYANIELDYHRQTTIGARSQRWEKNMSGAEEIC